MKDLILTFFIIFTGITIQAQTLKESPSSEVYEKQIGFNFTDFALRFLSFNEAVRTSPSILVLYKKGKDGKKWRYGIGGRVNWRKSPTNVPSTQSFELNLNIGREYYRKVAKEWTAYYGWEVLLRSGLDKVTFTSSNPFSNPQEDSLLRLSVGGQILVGMQYHFNERISLLTESSYLLVTSYQEDENDRKTYGVNSYYAPPISLILNYHF